MAGFTAIAAGRYRRRRAVSNVTGFNYPSRLLVASEIHRRVVLPKRIDHWSLTSLQQRLVKTGGRLIKHARYYWLLLAEGHLTQRVFAGILRRIWALRLPAG